MGRRRERIGIGAVCAALALAGAGIAGTAVARAIDQPPGHQRVTAAVGAAAAERSAGALIEIVTTPLQRGARAQIAASAVGVRECSLSFAGPDGLRSGPYGVSLNLRQVQWTWVVPNDARAGAWTATVACRGAQTTTTNLTLRAPTPGSQGIVRPGSLVVAPLSLDSDYDGGKGSGATCTPGVLDATSGYCTGYCTEFVWSLRPDLAGLGDATKWWREKSSPKGTVPAVHAVAWWRARAPGRPFGHVAYVTGVGAGTVTVREMNHGRGHWNVEDTRTINLQSEDAPDGYIYEGVAPKAPVPPRKTVTTMLVTTTTQPGLTVTTPALTVTTPPTTVTASTPTAAQPVHDSMPPVAEIVRGTALDTYIAAGSTTASGAQLAAGISVDVSCKVAVAASIDPATSPDGVWYRLQSAPWNDAYYALASGFLNGQPAGTTTPTLADATVPDCPAPPTDTTTTDTTTTGATATTTTTAATIAPVAEETITPSVVTVHAFPPLLYVAAGPFGTSTYAHVGTGSGRGPSVAPYRRVGILCKVVKYSKATRWITPYGYWYLIDSRPWNGLFYAPAGAFLNGDPPGGPYRTHVLRQIRTC